MKSMTGFGRATGDNGRLSATVTLKSVNGKALDLHWNGRGADPAVDLPLREALGRRLERGRVDLQVEVRPLAGAVGPSLDGRAVRQLYGACRPLIEEGILAERFELGDLMRLPELLASASPEASWGEAETALVLDVAGRACDELVASREREGAKLAAVIRSRLASLEALVRELADLREPVLAEMVASLKRRLGELLGEVAIDPIRLAQEVAVLADRTDIAEELDRLSSHLCELGATLDRPGPIGKRLDFQLQEVQRELNTLGTKCRHPEVSRRVLDAKVVGEQIREQVQNLE
ncbi:MAG TPA: YicC family protein [Thermoanaerobaculia bacterium]|nr:YicC family protein [Thermoanaerobaculia bacterium]